MSDQPSQHQDPRDRTEAKLPSGTIGPSLPTADDAATPSVHAEAPAYDAPATQLDFRRISESLERGVREILDAFEQKIAYDRHKDQTIDSLHEELQKYRSDLVWRTTRPLVEGLIRLHDNIAKVLEALRSKRLEDLTVEQLLGVIDGLRDDVTVVLAENGVETFEEPGEAFDAKRQRILRQEPATDIAQLGRIARRARPGFQRGEEVIQKERVVVYGPSVGERGVNGK